MTSQVTLLHFNGRHETVKTSSRDISGRGSLFLGWERGPNTSWGEASPLEGFGCDSLVAAEAELKSVDSAELDEVHAEVCVAFRKIYQGEEIAAGNLWASATSSALLDRPFHPISVLEAFSSRFQSASARHCFETLVMGAVAGSCGVPVVRLLTATPVAFSFKTSAVLDPLALDLVTQVKRFNERGVEVIKLKCGRDLRGECDALARLAEAIEQFPSLRLRLDVNRGFEPDECVQLSEAARGICVDWIEDPCRMLEHWQQISQGTATRLAIDEPLLQLMPDDLGDVPAQVVILKPMALGGWSRCLRFAAQARAQNKSVSLSHFFDGPVAMDSAISLAFALQSPEFTPGLGHHVALAQYLPRFARGLHGQELRIVEAGA